MRTPLFAGLALIVTGLAVGTPLAAAPPPDAATAPSVAEKHRISTIIVDNYRPYTFLNESGEPDGFSVAILRAVARTIGLEVGIRADTWEHATGALETGAIDVLPMMAYSVERDRVFDFSAPHTIAYDSVFVRSGSALPGSLEELSGKRVIVMNKDAAHQYLVAQGLDKPLHLVLVDSLPEALRQLDAGKADAAIMPQLVGLVLAKSLGLAQSVQSSAFIDRYNRPFSFAVKGGNDQLLSSLNYGLSVIKASGQYDAIYQKWFAVLEDPQIHVKTALKYLLSIAAVMLALVAWSLVLRRQVAARTRTLVASQRLLQGFTDNSGSLMYALDTDGRFVLVNRGLEAVLGIPREAAIGKTREQILPQETAAAHRANDLQVMAAGKPITFEETNEQPDGVHTYLSVKFPLLDEHGVPNGVGAVSTDITERTRAEHQAIAQATRLRLALQSGRAGAWDWDIAAGNLEWSPELFDIFGLDARKDRASFESWRSRLHPDDLETAERRISEALAAKSGLDSDYRVVLPDGDVRWINAVGEGVYDNTGRPVQMLGICVDITERKRAVEALKETERVKSELIDRLNQAQRVATVGSWEWDIQTNRVWWSDETYRIFGVDPQVYVPSFEANGAFIHPDDLPEYGRGFAHSLQTGDPLDFELRLLAGDGRLKMCNAKGNVVYVDGKPARFVGTIMDTTERWRSGQALAESEMRLRTLVQTIPDMVWQKDPDGVFLDCNAVFERFVGAARQDIVGKTDYDFVERDLADFFRERDRKAMAAGKPTVNEEWVTFSDDGHRSLLETIKTPVYGAGGRLIGVLGIARDITERIRAAEEKARLEDQLRQSQKVEAIGRLAGGVAHDFNTLTAIVLGYGEMLLGELDAADPRRTYAAEIVEAGRRSAALTRQLLAFSRKQTLQPEVLDLNALLRNFESMLGRLLGEGIELQCSLGTEAAHIKADPGQIEQVVTNLAVNARDAMPLGGKLTLETDVVEFDADNASGHEGVNPGKYVRLSLTDTGSGMDKATLDRLFEPFFTTKLRGQGTGLGLATAHGIVKQSGGYIWAASEPGKGATFTICLPWTDEQPAERTAVADEKVPRGRGERILVVEDEPGLRELCERLLVRLGYRVGTAGSGPDALLLMRARLEPDLVLTDVIMPGMSGVELARQLRDHWPGVRVLYMSGYPNDALAPHGVLVPGTPFIQKPFTERALALKVHETLAGKAPAAREGRRVLMIDDDEQYRELVQHFCVKGGHTFAGVDSAPAALAALAAQPFDVLLVDLNIPGTSGEQVLREIRAAGHAAPAIVLTGNLAAAAMDELRPLGMVQALEKSSQTGPLLHAIETVCSPAAAPDTCAN